MILLNYAKETWHKKEGFFMKKEEILEMSRKENKNKDIYETQVEAKGCTYASLTMVILATVYYCYEIFTGKGQNYSFYSIIALYCFVLYGYKAIKIEKRRSLHIFVSIIWGLTTVLSIIQYFR